jgi:glycopeptide antibiotics resistance protein
MRRYHLYLIVWGLFLIALSLIPGREAVPQRFPLDKVLHFIAFGYLGYLSARSLGWWGLLITLVFGAVNELLQLVASQRNVTFLDFAANEAGVIAGFFIGYIRSRRAISTG